MPHSANLTANKKYVSVELTQKQHVKLSELARENRMRVSLYVQLLFEAAFAARVGVQPDTSLDAVVARVMLLWGAGEDDDVISRELGISQELVRKIQSAWQDEVLGRVDVAARSAG